MRPIWFKQAFVAPIVAGDKTDTYRPPRDRRGRGRLPRVGETVAFSVGGRKPFATAVVTAVEVTRTSCLDPARLALVRSMCADVGEEIARVAFRVIETFVEVPAVHA